MLGSVDPHGLTCFNRPQVPRLIEELERLQAIAPDDDRNILLSGLRILVAQHMRQPHRFLWFIGD